MKKRKEAGKARQWPQVKNLQEFKRQYLPDEAADDDDFTQLAPAQFGQALADDSIRLMRKSLENLLQ
jgi:hypothetical protein